MCFSAAASISTGICLLPLGLYGVLSVRDSNPRMLVFAAFPLIFALQQFFEAAVWINYESANTAAMYTSARGFLFFSHFLWLVITPLAAWYAESNPRKQRLFALLTVIGAIFGAYIYLPLLLDAERLRINIVQHSIYYETFLFFHETVSKHVPRIIYAVLVIVPLIMSSHFVLRRYSLLLGGSIVFTYVFFEYAFISVWCFFAALLSVYIVYQASARKAPG